MQGMDIKEHMRDIPQGHDPAPIIRIYVDLNLQTLQKAGVISGPLPDADPIPTAAQSQAPATSSLPADSNGSDAAAVTQHPSTSYAQSLQAGQVVQSDSQPSASTSVAADPSPASSAGSLTSPGSQVSMHDSSALLFRSAGSLCMVTSGQGSSSALRAALSHNCKVRQQHRIIELNLGANMLSKSVSLPASVALGPQICCT